MDAPATETYATSDFVTTWRNVVQDPAAFFATMPETGGLGEPLRFLVLCAGINALGTFLVSLLSGSGSISYALWAFVAVVAGAFLIAAALTLVTQHLFEGHAGFEPVFRAVAYGAAPSVAFWVPLVGVLARLYTWFLQVRGMERVQGLDAVRATLAVTVAWVAVWLVAREVGGAPLGWLGR